MKNCVNVFRITAWQNGRKKFKRMHGIFMCTYPTEQKIVKSFSLLTLKNSCFQDAYTNAWARVRRSSQIQGSDLTLWSVTRIANDILSKLPAKNSLALPNSPSETRSEGQGMTWPDSHHPLLLSVSPCPFFLFFFFLQPAVVSCLILKSQVFGTRNFSCYLAPSWWCVQGPHLYNKKSELANIATIAGIMLAFVNHVGEISLDAIPIAP